MSLREAEDWIRKLNLQPHPEGGFYREVYRSDITVPIQARPSQFTGKRSLSTSIYYLLAGGDYSGWHRLKSDEIWHFYAGASVLLYQVSSAKGLFLRKLGTDWDAEQVPQIIIPGGNWFAAELERKDSYALVGCGVSPGFEFEDFELARPGELSRLYPEHRELMDRLTRRSRAGLRPQKTDKADGP